jgi:hypothetical protein
MSWKSRPLAPIERENDRLRMTIVVLRRELETKQGYAAKLELVLHQRCETIDKLTEVVDRLRTANQKLDLENHCLAALAHSACCAATRT